MTILPTLMFSLAQAVSRCSATETTSFQIWISVFWWGTCKICGQAKGTLKSAPKTNSPKASNRFPTAEYTIKACCTAGLNPLICPLNSALPWCLGAAVSKGICLILWESTLTLTKPLTYGSQFLVPCPHHIRRSQNGPPEMDDALFGFPSAQNSWPTALLWFSSGFPLKPTPNRAQTTRTLVMGQSQSPLLRLLPPAGEALL